MTIVFQLECCGVSSIAQGYRDWNMSYQFNCTTSNPQPEKCGVPFSCCRKSVISEAVRHLTSDDKSRSSRLWDSHPIIVKTIYHIAVARFEISRRLEVKVKNKTQISRLDPQIRCFRQWGLWNVGRMRWQRGRAIWNMTFILEDVSNHWEHSSNHMLFMLEHL